MKIRVMTIDGYAEVYHLWETSEGVGIGADDTYEGVKQYIERNPKTSFVALNDEEKIIGVIMAGHDGRRGMINHTAVLKEYRTNGIGHQLVQNVIKALQEEGIHKVFLVAFEQNSLGNHFWEKEGFTLRNDLVYRNKVIN